MYEFECESCHRRFERIQRFSDPSPDVCPHCGKGPIRKLMSTPAIQFKGSGFYITDYGKKGESSSKDSGSKDSGSKDSSPTSGNKDKDSSASKTSESSKPDTTKTESSKSDTSAKKESS